MVIYMKKYLDILKLSKLFAGIKENEIEDVLLCSYLSEEISS